MDGSAADRGAGTRAAFPLAVVAPEDAALPRIGDKTASPLRRAAPLLEVTPAARTPCVPTLKLPPEFSPLRQAACLTFHLMNTPDSITGYVVFALMGATIAVSILSFVAETMPYYRRPDPDARATESLATFRTIDIVCLAIFTVDYLGRLFTCVAIPWTDEYAPGGGMQSSAAEPTHWTRRLWRTVGRKVIAFVLSPLNVVDAVAIFPSYVPLATTDSALGDGSAKKLLILRAVRWGCVADGVVCYSFIDNPTCKLQARPRGPTLSP